MSNVIQFRKNRNIHTKNPIIVDRGIGLFTVTEVPFEVEDFLVQAYLLVIPKDKLRLDNPIYRWSDLIDIAHEYCSVSK